MSNRSGSCLAVLLYLLASATSTAHAAAVNVDGVSYFSAPGAYDASGVGGGNPPRQAYASETVARVSGQLEGAIPGQLTAGFPVEAYSNTGHPFGTHYTVFGVNPGTELTFVWRLSGSYSGAIDDQAFTVGFGWTLFNGANLWGGGFGGLSFVDNIPGFGNFAGSMTGIFSCNPGYNSAHSECGNSWNGIGTRYVSVRDSSSQGWIGQIVGMSGAGSDTEGDYEIELYDIVAPGDSFVVNALSRGPGAYIEFDSGARVAIRSAVPVGIPEPGTLMLAGAALLATGVLRRKSKRSS
jgi:hypothetical protein